MADKTGIEWTDATWNPVTGCTEVSPGCDRCYAKTFSERFRGTPGHYFEHGFDVQLRPAKLDLPLRWRRPRRIFVNSMSDLFHDSVPDDYIAAVWAVMAAAPQHTFQVLTKRHARMRSLLTDPDGGFFEAVADYGLEFDRNLWRRWQEEQHAWPLPNVWLGVSTETQQWADIRIPALLATPAAVRWISAEPLLGPIDLFGDAERPGPAINREARLVHLRSGHRVRLHRQRADRLGGGGRRVRPRCAANAPGMDPLTARPMRHRRGAIPLQAMGRMGTGRPSQPAA